jgi:hypothetical protein
MTLDDALEQLGVGADTLADVLSAVRVTVSEDLPDDTAPLAVDELADALVELAGEADRLRDHVRRLADGSAEPSRSDAQRLVVLAQRVLNDIADGLAERVLACERLAELERTTWRRGAPWRSWWSATVHGLADCEPAVRQVRDELFVCWRELVEDSPANGRAASSAPDKKP